MFRKKIEEKNGKLLLSGENKNFTYKCHKMNKNKTTTWGKRA